MNTRNDDVTNALKAVKDAAQTAVLDAGVKQEVMADVLGMTQSSVSKMLNYTGEQHLAVGHIPVLFADPYTRPVAMAVLIKVAGDCNVAINTLPDAGAANGSIDDELLAIDMLHARIIALRGGDMRKVLSVCQEVREQIGIIELEANKKLRGGK